MLDKHVHQQSSKFGYKPCKICGERIKFSAKKCVKCGSYQSYLRLFQLGPSLIAALAALMSSASALLLIYYQHRSSYPDPVISYVKVDWDGVRLGIVNNGTFPTYVNYVMLSATGIRNGDRSVTVLLMHPKYEQNMVNPTSSALLSFGLDQQDYASSFFGEKEDESVEADAFLTSNNLTNQACLLRINFFPAPYSYKGKTTEYPIPCTDFGMLAYSKKNFDKRHPASSVAPPS